MAHLEPYTEKIGVDNAFGWLHQPDGPRRLVENVAFICGTGLVVDLETGLRHLVAADGTSLWTPLEPDQACGLVGIPEPVLEEGRRRVDPFHVERHRSALFCAICDIAYERRLPCGYSLLAHRHGRWTDRAFIYAADENPEQFAAAVSLLVGQGNSIEAAIRTELGADAEIAASDTAGLDELLHDTGWQQALADLPALIDAHRQRLTATGDLLADDAQLALL